MSRYNTLTVMSLLSLVLAVFHISDDIARGIDPGDLRSLFGVLIAVVWLYATLELAGRRAGLIIVLLLSIGGVGVFAIHAQGNGLTGGRIAGTAGVYFWVWTLFALGVTSAFAAILAARELWQLLRRRPQA